MPEGIDPAIQPANPANGARIIFGPRATFIGTMILAIAEFLPNAGSGDVPRLAEVLHSILMAALSSGRVEVETTEASREAGLRAKVYLVIEENIASARLDVARVAHLSGVSKTTLYRLFDGFGGIAAHIRRLRLERVRADLCDPSQRSVPIAALAERNGLHNVASFNRSFRRLYGMSPQEMKKVFTE